MGIVTHCFVSSRLLKAAPCGALTFPWALSRCGGCLWSHTRHQCCGICLAAGACLPQTGRSREASRLCLHLVAPCSLPLELWGSSSRTPTVQAPCGGLQAAERGWRDQHKVRDGQQSTSVYFPLAQAQCGCHSCSCETPEAVVGCQCGGMSVWWDVSVVGCQWETRGPNERQ